jgi:hypothetical protein
MQKQPSGRKPNPGSKITIDTLAGMMNNSFEHLERSLDAMDLKLTRQATDMEQRLTDRLEKIEFRLTGEDQRISTLEDRIRQIATKVGIEFNK